MEWQFYIKFAKRVWIIGAPIEEPFKAILTWHEKAGYYVPDAYGKSLMVGRATPDQMYFYWPKDGKFDQRERIDFKIPLIMEAVNKVYNPKKPIPIPDIPALQLDRATMIQNR